MNERPTTIKWTWPLLASLLAATLPLASCGRCETNAIVKFEESDKRPLTSPADLSATTASFAAHGDSASDPHPSAQSLQARTVLLFIGDGMGSAQIVAARRLAWEIHKRDLALGSIPVAGSMSTHSASHPITDSAAAATAMATGRKTANGIISMDTNARRPLETIAQKVAAHHLGVGIISSVSIDHATPAAFYAHRPSRNDYYEIALQLADSGFAYFGGGGLRRPTGITGLATDATKRIRDAGYRHVHTRDDILKATLSKKVFAVAPDVLPDGSLPWAIDGPATVSLATFTEQGIRAIEHRGGGFLMVEGGKIDWACHDNDAATAIHQIFAFDDAVAAGLAFYRQHPRDTLLIVTADHETGGMGFFSRENDWNDYLSLLVHQTVSISGFVDILKKMTAAPSTPSFEDVLRVVGEQFGLGHVPGLTLTTDETTALRTAYEVAFLTGGMTGAVKGLLSMDRERKLAMLAVQILNKKAKLRWTTRDHSATPVPVRAIGPGSERLRGIIDNTHLPKVIADVMNL